MVELALGVGFKDLLSFFYQSGVFIFSRDFKASMHRWGPEEYKRCSSAQHLWESALISSLTLLGGEAVLDIGCGDGKVTAELSSLVPRGRVVGLDSSQEMIDFAMRSFPSSEHSNLSFRFGDAMGTDFSEEFDLARLIRLLSLGGGPSNGA